MNRYRRLVLGAAIAIGLAIAGPGSAQTTQTPKPNAKSSKKTKTARSDDASKASAGRRKPRRINSRVYMGREIAQVMSFEGGADWLVRPEREQEERPEAMLDALKLKEGQTIADVGAGVGYLSLRIAKRIGPKGKVLASDLQPAMLESLAANAKNFGIPNIKTIQATVEDPKLPENAVDLAILTDVYHELSQPELVIDRIRRSLKTGGRLVLVEFRGEDPSVPIREEHKMTLRQVRREIEPMGFEFVESIETLPWQHVIVFNRPADEIAPEKTPKPAAKSGRDSGEPTKSKETPE